MAGKKEINKSGELSLPINYLILIIILAVVIIIAVFIVIQLGIVSSWKDMLPDWIVGNSTNYYGERGCFSGSSEVGYISQDDYIILGQEKTNLYIKESMIYVDGTGGTFSEDSILGEAYRGNIDIDRSGMSSEDILKLPKYQGLLPTKKDFELFLESFIEGSSICIQNERKNRIEESQNCILTCALMEGVCSISPVSGKISNTQLDCKEGELCYIDSNYDSLNSSNLELLNNSFMMSGVNYPGEIGEVSNTFEDILKIQKFTITPGDKIQIYTGIKHSIPICYYYDSNTKYIKNGYYDSDSSGHIIDSGRMSYSDQKMIQFIAWNKEKNEKVIKRWKIESRDLEEGEPGKQIRDSDFLKEVKNAEINEVFYFYGYKKSFETTPVTFVWDYKIKKISEDSIEIYANDEKNEVWHRLDCNKGSIKWWDNSIKIENLESSLIGTLESGKCKW